MNQNFFITGIVKKHLLSGSKAPFRGLGVGLLLLLLCLSSSAQQATWFWYPADYEIWLSNQMQNRRTDRGTFFPVFWKVDNHYVLMDFHKEFNLKEAEEVTIYAEGQYNVKLDGKPFEGT